MRHAPVAGLALLLASASARTAEARSFRVNEIPNGAQRSCLNCHETDGGIVFNAFGSDVRSFLTGPGQTSQRHVDWGPELAARDSDGDGFTNGEELGDPAGTWRPGDPAPGGAPTNPGDPASAPTAGACGDGVLAPAETCDGAELRGATCESQNLGDGTIACTAECRLDTSRCGGAAPAGDDDDDRDEDAAADPGCAAAAAPAPAAGASLALVTVAALGAAARRRPPRAR